MNVAYERIIKRKKRDVERWHPRKMQLKGATSWWETVSFAWRRRSLTEFSLFEKFSFLGIEEEMASRGDVDADVDAGRRDGVHLLSRGGGLPDRFSCLFS